MGKCSCLCVATVYDRLFYPFPLEQKGAQWLNGRMLDSRPKGRGFESHRRHCVVSLSKNINPSLVLVQPRKTRPFITERLLMGRKESNQTNPLEQIYQLITTNEKMTNSPGCLQQRHNRMPVFIQPAQGVRPLSACQRNGI